LHEPQVSGLFNVGTGKARSWLDLGKALFAAIGREPRIEFIDMPAPLIEKYQYHTAARMDKLAAAGFPNKLCDIETGVRDYVQTFLGAQDPYR